MPKLVYLIGNSTSARKHNHEEDTHVLNICMALDLAHVKKINKQKILKNSNQEFPPGYNNFFSRDSPM